MDQINLYIYTTVKGPGTKSGCYTYLLEYITEKGPVTLTKQGELEEVTENQANLRVMNKAMERLKKPCEVMVYTENRYIQKGAESWLTGWKEAGWMTARKKPVANREEWEKTAEILGRNLVRFCVGEPHSYRNWMIAETEKMEKERRKCLTNSENLIRSKN